MKFDRYTPEMMAAGAIELRENLEWLAKAGIAPRPDSDPGSAHHSANLAAFIIRRNGPGWTADVVFDRVPQGMPDVVGTPEAAPLPSRDAALAAGRLILTMVLSASHLEPEQQPCAMH